MTIIVDIRRLKVKLAQRQIVWTIGFRAWQEYVWTAKQLLAAEGKIYLKKNL